MIGLFLYRRNVTLSHKGMVKDIIEQFKNFCEKEGWIQEQIAEKLECSRSHISKIFSGARNPSIKVLEKMEEVMKNGR